MGGGAAVPEPLWVTSVGQKALPHPRKIAGGCLCRNWGQRSIITIKDAPGFLMGQKVTKVGGALAGSQEKDQTMHSFHGSALLARAERRWLGGGWPGRLCSHELSRGSGAAECEKP